jgi:hypothetical protein
VLRKNQDRRLRGGHPWVFSNEVAQIVGAPADGDLVEIADFRNAFLGRAYYNRKSLICARIISRGRDEVDEALFVRRIERALKLRESMDAGASAARIVYGESDQLPGLVVDRYGDYLAVQGVLTLGIEVAVGDGPRGARSGAESRPRRDAHGGFAAARARKASRSSAAFGGARYRDNRARAGWDFSSEVDLHHAENRPVPRSALESRHAETRAGGQRVLDLYCTRRVGRCTRRAAVLPTCSRWIHRPRTRDREERNAEP